MSHQSETIQKHLKNEDSAMMLGSLASTRSDIGQTFGDDYGTLGYFSYDFSKNFRRTCESSLVEGAVISDPVKASSD